MMFPLAGNGQCQDCPNVSAESIDYCFIEKVAPGMCASFVSGETYFYFSNKNSSRPAPVKYDIPAGEVLQQEWLVTMGTGKKPILNTAEILFIEHAFEAWKFVVAIENWDKEELSKSWTFRESGLAFRILKMGEGKMPEAGKKITVHYTGWLPDGSKFDSSLDRKQSFSFVLGQRKVILGWEEGMSLFPVGSTVMLRIPPEMGYGERGNPPRIPPKSILYFQVQILSTE